MSKLLSMTQFFDKYSRYNYETGTREDWSETVQRVTDYLFSFDNNSVLSEKDKADIHTAILNQDVMPSMRNLAMAGPAAARQNVTSYNCSAVVIDNVYAFYEAVIILMSGSGLGYSVEKRFTEKLPPVTKQYPYSTVNTLIIADNTEGWADAIYTGIRTWLSGKDLLFNFKNIRPAGAPLKIKGGRASGPQVLKESLVRIREIIFARQGEQLRPIDVHDIMCHIAKCIVSGGSRRSAMIAIFDLDDTEMLTCKDSGNVQGNEQRYLSNNSAAIMGRMSYDELESFMNRMFDSYSGEPGIFSRYAIEKTLPERRKYSDDMLPNPCAEINLRGSGQFCNLSSVVARPDDSLAQLKDKVRIAAIIGTLQAMSQHFPGLRQSWVDNQEEERLLGVDLNGVMDVPGIRDARVLQILKNTAIDTNQEYAIKLGINPATAVTCVKPSGNSSVLLDTSPGIHARWSDFYIRRVQLHESNPILAILNMYGVPTETSNHLPHTYVASFPVKAPEGAITNGAFNALQQLENWKLFKENWAEHSVSCTIAYRESERQDIIQWVYDNQDIISGLSFLPKDDHTYLQAPYEKISAEKYRELMQTFPTEIDWSILHEMEKGLGDTTNGASLAACSSDKCLVSF